MKKPQFIKALALFCLISASTYAQVEVHDFGNVSLGGKPANRPACKVFVDGGAAGSALEVRHNNLLAWSIAVNTEVNNDSCTSYGLHSTVGPAVFYVSGQGWLYANGAYFGSDSTLKKDIVKINSSLDKIKMLSGYTYHFAKVKLDSGPEKGKIYYPDTLTHMGVMAQEVQKVAPYMVRKVRNGKLAVDYMQLIPLLLEGIKELDAKNKKQADQLALLQSRFDNLAESLDTSGGNYKLTSNKSAASSYFVLYQNSPNPWDKQTGISYSLNGAYTSANMYIFDLQGTLKKSYALNGSGTLTLKSNELAAGMYLYSLVVDGKQIDVKRMLLTN